MEITQLLYLIEQARALMIERGEDPGPIDALKNTVNEGGRLEPDQVLAELNRLTGEPVILAGEALGHNVVRFLPFSENSPWCVLIDELGDELTPAEAAFLTRFVANHGLVGSPPDRTELRPNHKEVLKILLSRSDLEQRGSVGSLALKYFLLNLFVGVGRDLRSVDETGSLILFDTWILDTDELRSNAWIFLDHPDSLIPSLVMTGRSDRQPPVSHVSIFQAGGQTQKEAVKDQIRDLLVKGTWHELVPGLKELVGTEGHDPDPDPDSVPVPPIDLEEESPVERSVGETKDDQGHGARTDLTRAGTLRVIRGGRAFRNVLLTRG